MSGFKGIALICLSCDQEGSWRDLIHACPDTLKIWCTAEVDYIKAEDCVAVKRARHWERFSTKIEDRVPPDQPYGIMPKMRLP